MPYANITDSRRSAVAITDAVGAPVTRELSRVQVKDIGDVEELGRHSASFRRVPS